MHINLSHTESWHQLNESIHELLGLPADLTVRSYRGIHHAAFEVVCGTASFYSHKRSVAWRKGQSFSYATPIPWLYKDGYQVQVLPQKNPANDIPGWVESLKKDTSLVMMNEDNPITGETFDNDELDRLLDEKKIFSIRTCHGLGWTNTIQKIRPSTVMLCELSENFAIAICGSRYKSPVQMANYFSFDSVQCLKLVTQALSKKTQQMSVQLSPPSEWPLGFEVYSVSDRVLVYHRSVNAQALADELLKFNPELAEQIFVLNSCAQGFTDWDWWEGKPTAEQMRGMLVLDLSAMQNKFLLPALTKALQHCQIG